MIRPPPTLAALRPLRIPASPPPRNEAVTIKPAMKEAA